MLSGLDIPYAHRTGLQLPVGGGPVKLPPLCYRNLNQMRATTEYQSEISDYTIKHKLHIGSFMLKPITPYHSRASGFSHHSVHAECIIPGTNFAQKMSKPNDNISFKSLSTVLTNAPGSYGLEPTKFCRKNHHQ